MDVKANPTEKKTYTLDEIKKLAPGYRGKAEKFDPAKAGKKKQPPTRSKLGPKSPNVPPPQALDKGASPTAQRNDLILSESIFGVDITVTEIKPREDFSTSFAQLPAIALEIHRQCQTDERQMDRILVKEEVSYYATSLLWMKLIDVKAKQGRESLTSEEKSIRKATEDIAIEFNVSHPVYMYLNQIGTYKDGLEKTTELNVPELPIVKAQGMGGYHAAEVNCETHNLFEEVPSLGVASDVVMALCQNSPTPKPNYRFKIPNSAKVNENLTGHIKNIGPIRPEIVQRLAGQGIISISFPELVKETRFNLKYVRSISDIISKFHTFQCDKICFPRLTKYGGETQVITTPDSRRVMIFRLLVRESPTWKLSQFRVMLIGASRLCVNWKHVDRYLQEDGNFSAGPNQEEMWNLNSDDVTVIGLSDNTNYAGVGQDIWIALHLDYPLIYGLKTFEMTRVEAGNRIVREFIPYVRNSTLIDIHSQAHSIRCVIHSLVQP